MKTRSSSACFLSTFDLTPGEGEDATFREWGSEAAPAGTTYIDTAEASMTVDQINETMSKYMDAFNANDLDGVMRFFSDDAVYEPGDGKTHRGKTAVRAAFEPQFGGALGTMRFDECDRLIDADQGKVAIRWICRHDLAQFHSRGLKSSIRKSVFSLLYGTRFSWHGVDVFLLDGRGLISEKYTYSWYGSRPYLERGDVRRSRSTVS